ncbi:MAG TPA: hypothetical protein VFG68_14540 [Fimbriiglobus sp.]|nr:hypothetical protein [Fimbriiglobus sp.]
MTPTTPETELTPDLIERVMKLSAENKDRLFGLLLDDPDEPPDVVTDWPAEIQRRLESIAVGGVRLMTREESDAAIRERLRALGVELP